MKKAHTAVDIWIEKTQSTMAVDMLNGHIHPEYELYFLLAGERRYFIDGEIYNIAPGNLVVVPGNAIHQTYAFHQKGYERYVLYFAEESLSDIRRTLGEEVFSRFSSLGCVQFPPEQVIKMRERFEKLFTEEARGDEFSLAMKRSLLGEIVVSTLRYGVKKERTAGESEDKIQLAARYIAENFSEPLTLEDAARMSCMEKTYFSKRFKALTGINFSSYLTQLRLAAARELLLNTDMNISVIASHTGFSGSNYFGDVFLRVYGMSPTEYRKQKKDPLQNFGFEEEKLPITQ